MSASFVEAATPLSLSLEDGIKLDATYYPADRPGPGLLFLNMCNPTVDQSEWTEVAMTMSAKGFHVLTFDYRGFGQSGGTRPTNLRSIDEAMPYWRENWMSDVRIAFNTLASQPGVSEESVGIAGASCGVFLGIEYALANRNVKSLVLLGGPSDESQRTRLAERDNLPILLMAGDLKGPNESQGTLEWSDAVFEASANERTRILKYKTKTYGTLMLEDIPETKRLLVEWFENTVER